MDSRREIRVAAYCRVSTALEAQQSSLETQMAVFGQRIGEHPDWTLVGIYADEGLSGTSMAKRPKFLEMVEAAKKGEIDYIITKSISRFARNTVECVETVRLLQSYGTQVLFEKENIDTATSVSEMLLTVLAAFAQEESRSISENLKWGIRKRYENGDVRWQKCYGYRKGADGSWVINESEAETVRFIFEAYERGTTISKIVKRLNEDGVPSPSGGKWTGRSVTQIQESEKYIGDVICQRYITVNHLTHRSVKNDAAEVPSYYIRDHHPPIVSRKTAERVRKIKQLRNQRLEGDQYPYGCMNLRCPICGERLMQIQTRAHVDRLCWGCFSESGCRGYALKSRALNNAVIEAANAHFACCANELQIAGVEFYWLDEYVKEIRIGSERVEVIWKDGSVTRGSIDVGDPRNDPVRQGILYSVYLNRLESGEYVTRYPKGYMARLAMQKAAAAKETG